MSDLNIPPTPNLFPEDRGQHSAPPALYKGGKPRIDRAEVARLKAEGLNPTQIAAELGINRVTVYRLTAELDGKAA